MFLSALVCIFGLINMMHSNQECLLSLSINLLVVLLINGSIVFFEMSQKIHKF